MNRNLFTIDNFYYTTAAHCLGFLDERTDDNKETEMNPLYDIKSSCYDININYSPPMSSLNIKL